MGLSELQVTHSADAPPTQSAKRTLKSCLPRACAGIPRVGDPGAEASCFREAGRPAQPVTGNFPARLSSGELRSAAFILPGSAHVGVLLWWRAGRVLRPGCE